MGGLVRQLVDGDGPPTVAVDFGGGRAEAEFSDLFAGLPGAGPVVELAPLPVVLADRAPARCDTYVNAYVEALSGLGPAACLMGYCVGSALAHELALRLRAEDRGPGRLVLFDAAPVSPGEVRAAYEKVARGAPGDPAALEAAAREAGETGDGALLDRVQSELVGQLKGECEGMGIDPGSAVAEELIARQVGWFSYVVAACTAPLSHYDGEVVLVCSTKQVTPSTWPASGFRRYDVDATQPEMLAAPAVGELVGELLAEVPR